MSPIEQHLATRLERALAASGAACNGVAVLSAEAENWRYRVSAAGRVFELGFNHREQMWCREVTPGGEKHLISNDQPPVCDSGAAWRLGVRLITTAMADATFPPRDPPVI